MRRYSTVILVIFCLIRFPLSQPQPGRDAAHILLELQKLQVLGSVLYVAAHPDDENTAALAYFSDEKHYRTAYLALTRGDGGQNLIGSEKGPLLGIIRTQELLDARRIDGGLQFFTRAIDFGYSKSPEESLAKWGRQKVLSDVVWIIRRFRPDVIITRFTPELGGHGHHRASAMLAREAFKAAADPKLFPEQLQYVQPWQAKRIVWNAWRPKLTERPKDAPPLISVDLGTFNPILGKSYTEIAAISRSMHKSQGFGSSARLGSYLNYFELSDGKPMKKDLFEGVNTGWSRVPGGKAVGKILKHALSKFNPDDPSAILPLLLKAHQKLSSMQAGYWRDAKMAELNRLIRQCAGIELRADSREYSYSPGDKMPLKLLAIERAPQKIELKSVEFEPGNFSLTFNQPLKFNEAFLADTAIFIPASAPFSTPYWLQEPPIGSLYTVKDQKSIGKPEGPPALQAVFHLKIGDQEFAYRQAVRYRWTDPVAGERVRKTEIVPPVTLKIDGEVFVYSGYGPKSLTVEVTARKAWQKGWVRLLLPRGWNSSPKSAAFTLDHKGEVTRIIFNVRPAEKAQTGVAKAVAEIDGKFYDRKLIHIEYPHIPIQTVLLPAETHLVHLQLRKRGQTIGYIMGSGDEVPDILRQIGYTVHLLSDTELDTVNFAKFDAVVAGVRAYNVRQHLRQVQPRLMSYVKSGGTYMVQYSKSYGMVTKQIGPYPLTLSHDRITVEEAPLKFIQPENPLLTAPNQITQEDFNGWIQERGLYFANKWDPRYQPIFSGHDPGEPDRKGGLLVAHYGKGIYIYSGFSFFRELPAGVPGAIRLFVNLLSARGNNE